MSDGIANVAALRAALGELQVNGDVRSHGAVAVLVTANPEQLADAGVRQRVLEVAKHHGFRTLAVELPSHEQASDIATRAGRADIHST